MNSLLEQDLEVLAFGRHILLPGRGELQAADGSSVMLGPRAVAVLLALIGARGNVVSHEELLCHAWPGQVIHESNLRVQIAALRKALGGDRNLIGTVAGRGYVFAGRLSAVPGQLPGVSDGNAVRPCLRRLPLPMAELIGRERQLREALERLAACRLLTLTGTGGIGKTLLALGMAHRSAVAPAGGVAWVELADSDDAAGLAAAVACALGVEEERRKPGPDDGEGRDGENGGCGADGGRDASAGACTPAMLASHIGQRPLLLVLDNCEHLADAVARLVETLLQGCPQLRMLATSRQPLLAAGETVWRVPPLEVPAEDEVDGARLLHYSAVQLFMARVRAADSHFHPAPRVVLQIAAICRRLEGLPLAIELAAACVPALGVQQTAAGLDDMLRLLRHGRRNAPLRHQSLRAALDWSYALLAGPMRIGLLHLATLPAGFTIEAAVAALAPYGFLPYEAIDALAGLVNHSLALVDHRTHPTRYRLPATTRAYALALRDVGAGTVPAGLPASAGSLRER